MERQEIMNFSKERFLELFLACAVKKGEYVISKNVVEQNLAEFVGMYQYDFLFYPLELKCDESKKHCYYDLSFAFCIALGFEQVLLLSSVDTPMYLINFSESNADDIIEYYKEEEAFGIEFVNAMQDVVKNIKFR